MSSSDTEQRLQTPENTTEAASAKRQKFKERARVAKMISDKTGDATAESAAKGGELVAERLQMVLERLYGPQYRAAQRFLKNRTLNKMNAKQTGMTLYERIMAYRKMKGDESPGEEGLSSRGGSQEASDTPPVNRKHDGSPQTLERSDTSFASVDISDLTNSEEEKNRTPTPPPTFEKPAISAKRNLRETYEEKATARDVYVELDDKEDQSIRSEQAKRKNREVIRQTSDAYEEVTVHDESKVKVNQSEKVKGEYRETIEDERVQDGRKVEKVVVVHKTADEVTRSVHEAEKRTEKSEDRRGDKGIDKRSESETKRREDKRSDSRTERREENTSTSRAQRLEEKVVNKHEERREDRVELAAVHKNVRREEIRSESRDDNHQQSASRSDSRKKPRENNRSDSWSDRNAERHDIISKSAAITVVGSESASSSKKSATEQKSRTSEVKKSDERSSSRSSSKGEKSFLEMAAEHVEASSAGSQDRPRADDPRKDKPTAADEKKPRSDAPGAGAAKASTSREKRPDVRSASPQAEKKNTAQTIAALDKLADSTLNKLLSNESGNDDEEDEAVRKALENAFSPEFQAELDDFLRTT